MGEPDAQLAQLGQRRLDLAGDQVEAARLGAQPDLALVPHRPHATRALTRAAARARPGRRGSASSASGSSCGPPSPASSASSAARSRVPSSSIEQLPRGRLLHAHVLVAQAGHVDRVARLQPGERARPRARPARLRVDRRVDVERDVVGVDRRPERPLDLARARAQRAPQVADRERLGEVARRAPGPAGRRAGRDGSGRARPTPRAAGAPSAGSNAGAGAVRAAQQALAELAAEQEVDVLLERQRGRRRPARARAARRPSGRRPGRSSATSTSLM